MSNRKGGGELGYSHTFDKFYQIMNDGWYGNEKVYSINFSLLSCIFGSYCWAPANAAAENKLDWTTTDLYYVLNSEGYPTDVLIIEGYFANNTDKYINYIYEFDLTATIRADIGAGYKDQVHGNFKNFEKIIEPYSTSNHKFRISKAKIIWPIEEYEVIQGVTKWKYSNAAG